ncbi:MAG: cell wall-binding protein, partial [Peptococcaceae bacterium]|nr:cell wall-binding protein [Peptococcaceae bacterium]
TGPDSIRLTWDEVDDAMAYWVYRSESSSGEYILIGGTDQDYYIDRNLEKGETYYYKVKAVSKSGEESGFSNKAHATTDKDDNALDAPKNLEAEADGPDSIILTWDKVKNARKYYIYRSETSSGTYKYIDWTDDTEYIDDGLKSNKTYYYKVKAVDRYNNESSYSNKAYARTDKD